MECLVDTYLTLPLPLFQLNLHAHSETEVETGTGRLGSLLGPSYCTKWD